MSTRDALHALVHDYPGGASSLAPRVGLAASTLRCMANPSVESHDWPLKRVEQVMALTGDLRPLHALASEFGGVFVPLAAAAEQDADVLLGQLAELGREFGEVCTALQSAMADGRITHRELRALKDRTYALHQAASALELAIERRAEAQPLFKTARIGTAA